LYTSWVTISARNGGRNPKAFEIRTSGDAANGGTWKAMMMLPPLAVGGAEVDGVGVGDALHATTAAPTSRLDTAWNAAFTS
jgi:hypothetical protein